MKGERAMAKRESRDEEFIRRMRALGYEPSLVGMDDEDIEDGREAAGGATATDGIPAVDRAGSENLPPDGAAIRP
jgi:hypothetical protein